MEPKESLLIVSDWTAAADSIKTALKKENHILTPLSLQSVDEKKFNQKPVDLVILCLQTSKLAKQTAVISEIRQINDLVPIIVISDNADWKPAVNSIKLGATEYLRYPVNKEELVKMVEKNLKLYRMTRRIFALEDPNIMSPFEGIVGRSEKMQDNFRMISAVAKSNATVVVTGQSGTGKELVAKAIHNLSNRSSGRFVDLNCGAIPRDLLENELFGHEKGSFTGAHKRYLGSFEVAHKGTLFLDEISEMDPLLQVKLLRVLQERSFMRIGGTERIDVDVRIIAATNRDLQETIDKGQFREDLYYRLNVVNIHIPSLKDRREDIPLLAQHFLEFYSAKNNRIFLDFAPDAVEALVNYDWPGNVRELENTIERIVVLNNDSQVKLKHLPKPLQKVSRTISVEEVSPVHADDVRMMSLEDLERQAIEMALMKFQGNVTIAARTLRIGQATLYRKVKKYGLEF